MDVGFTPYFKNCILNYFFNGDSDLSIANKFPCNLYVGLFVEQDAAVGPVELTVGAYGYARAKVEFNDLSASGMIKNTSPVTFGKAEADWTSGGETITHIGIFTSHVNNDGEHVSDQSENPLDGAAVDSMIAFLPLAAEEQVHEGEIFQLNPGAIKIQLI